MLTKEHAIAEYDFSGGRIYPDTLSQKHHAQYRLYAEQMLGIYRAGAGQTRRELHRAIQNVFAQEPDCPVKRIYAFCKLLDDQSRYHRDTGRQAAQLRQRVFARAATFHPLVTRADRMFEYQQTEVKQQIADELGCSWAEIEGRLFSDVMEFHRLKDFPGYSDANALLARYNVAQYQVALYGATSLTVWATDDFKTILRYAKLARLMHRITQLDVGQYRITFDGPASALRRTRRYGVGLAKFLPALIACRDWRMHAEVLAGKKGWRLALKLSSQSGLTSHLPAPEDFDSELEMKFAEKWGNEPRDGWTLRREGTVLYVDQSVFIPDFTFVHKSGKEVALEIIGFWTPEYLAAKEATLKKFTSNSLLLAVSQAVETQLPNLPENAIIYKTAIKINDVLQQLQKFVE
ncbi:MAG: putative nuclease of restriction endonuclease-like RecB superfamily [Pirellulaceae bacterium]|jgi:predicted nuclease of restriction endonuclease-like RecB superfamily